MKDHFRGIARIYDRLIGVPHIDRQMELLALPCGCSLLEVGGGTGRVLERLEGEAHPLVIADYSAAMLREAHAKQGIHCVRTTAERLPFPDDSFERILVVDALHHFPDQEGAVSEMARVLRPGGRLVIEEPDIRRFIVRAVALGERLLRMESTFHPPERIRGMAETAGLTARVEEDGGFSAWVVADKPPETGV
jgi:ubiquinone/menaquinone biosynthesis C-methylase UbiE